MKIDATENADQGRRTYKKVNDQQRQELIAILDKNRAVNIKQAAQLVGMNYYNAKRIYGIYQRMNGRTRRSTVSAQTGCLTMMEQEKRGSRKPSSSNIGYLTLMSFDH